MPRGLGRPVAVLVLSDSDRSSLAAQVRRPRIARARADRGRMRRRGAEGLGNQAVAAALGVHEPPVGQGRRRCVRARLAGRSPPARARVLGVDEQR